MCHVNVIGLFHFVEWSCQVALVSENGEHLCIPSMVLVARRSVFHSVYATSVMCLFHLVEQTDW